MENKEYNKEGNKEEVAAISGQLAIIVNDNKNNVQTIPLKLSHSKQAVTVGILKQKNEVLWGTPFGYWMRIPSQPENTGSHKNGIGLSVLTNIEDLFVTEFINIFRDINDHKTVNYYLVKNIKSENVFLGKVNVNFKAKSICGKSNQTDIKFMDGFNREVLFCRQLLRCFLYNQLVMKVMVQPSKQIASIYEDSSLFTPEYTIKDQKGNILLHVKGQKNVFCCTSRSNIGPFDIYSGDKSKVGVIQSNGTQKTHFKESFILSANFSIGLDVFTKATIVAVMFLIKSLHYY